MVISDAVTVQQYIEELPEDRRAAIATVRDVIVANLPDGVVETVSWGMIGYEIPLETFPDTYNKKPLFFAGLASQKNHMAVYLNAIYMNEGEVDWFKKQYLASGKKLDMGKSCVRFKKLDQLPVELIGEAVGKLTVEQFLDYYRGVKG